MDRESIANLLRRVRLAQRLPESYGYLDGIARDVEAIGRELISDSPDNAQVEGWLAGLGRLITDDFAFSESSLGEELLQFVNEISAELDRHEGGARLVKNEARKRASKPRTVQTRR
jgi:hypothetical protein